MIGKILINQFTKKKIGKSQLFMALLCKEIFVEGEKILKFFKKGEKNTEKN